MSAPLFAMTKMDDEVHHECELYVEDPRAATWLREILSRHAKELSVRCAIVPYGAANVGVALGQMNAQKRFPRPTVVFLDGDQYDSPGCVLLPGRRRSRACRPERAQGAGLVEPLVTYRQRLVVRHRCARSSDDARRSSRVGARRLERAAVRWRCAVGSLVQGMVGGARARVGCRA